MQPDGTYVVKATAEGKANGKTYTSSMQKTVYVSTPKASSITVAGTGTSSITLNITNPSGKTLKVYKNSNGSLTELRSISLSAGSTTLTVGDLYSGQKYRFKVFGQNEEDYVDAETQGTGYDTYFDDDDVASDGYRYDYIESVGLGIASSIIENGADSINMTSVVFHQIFVSLGLPQSIADEIYVNFADRKENVLENLRSKVKNPQGYYVGRVVTDSALAASAAQGTIAGVELIIAGLTGEAASAAAEALSLGTGTPVLAVTAVVSTVAVAVGAVVAVGSISLSITSGGALIDDVTKLKNANSSKSNSLILRENMIKAGMQEPSYKPNVAHHIVPATAQKAQAARDILKKCGIDDINCAENGVFLPGKEGLAGAGNASVHTGRHLDSYITTVTKRLQDGLPSNPTAANKQTAFNILNEIRQELLSGALKLQN